MKNVTAAFYFVCSALSLVAGTAHGAETKPEANVFDGAHKEVSQRLSDMIGQLDIFFGNEEKSTQSNESWAKLRLDLQDREGESPEFKANIKLKMVLPSAKKRLRLLLSTEEDDLRGPNRTSDPALSRSSGDDGNVAVALRFLRKIRKNDSIKFDLGARVLDSKAQVFFRVGTNMGYQLNDNWWGSVNNNAVYFSESGFKDALNIKLERYVDKKEELLFLSASNFTWEADRKGAHVGQTLGLYRDIGDNRSIAAETLLGLHTSPKNDEHRFQGIGFRLRFRHNVWRPWFFYEIWPSVSWPQDRDYERTYGGMIRIETIFGLNHVRH